MLADEIKKLIIQSGLTVTMQGVDNIGAEGEASFVCDNLSYVLGGADGTPDCESWCDGDSCASCSR